MRRLRKHPLIAYLLNSKGNPRTLIYLEPLWGIPYNLIAPFITLYMYAQGVTDVHIGILLSAAMAAQVFFSFMGGIIADKIGRKTTTILGDFFGWSVACFIWALSDNFWLFLIAALFNCFEQVNQTAWQCLLVEDADENDMLHVYTWIHIGGLVAVFFAPLSGLFIGRFSLVPVVRALYFTFSVTMLIKSFITWRFTSETKQGRVRMEQTKNTPALKMAAEYKHLIPKIFKDKTTLQLIALSVLLHITGIVSGNFFGLYVNTNLGIEERWLAVFPILRAVVMLVFMFGIQHHIERVRLKIPLWTGLVIYAGCQIFLLVSPAGQILPLLVFILLEAVAYALVIPRKDALLAVNIDKQERARIMALMVSFMIAFSSPFGYLAGLLSSVDRRLPFVFVFALYLLAIVITGWIKDKKETQ
jgi:MFS family permease